MKKRSEACWRFLPLARDWLLVLLMLGFVLVPARAVESNELLGQLKVAYLYNFTRFVQWPAPADAEPFVIGVIGDPGMVDRLRVLEDRQVEGRPIEIQSYAGIMDIRSCQILFVGSAAAPEIESIVRHTAGEPTLLLGDTMGYVGRGIAIEFYLQPDVFREKQRLRFKIDPKALRQRGLKVSAQLLDVAEVLE